MLRMLAILNHILEFILPAQTSFLTWAGSRPIKLSSFVPLSLLKLSILNQSICFWSFDLETIIPLHVSFELVSCFYNQWLRIVSSYGCVPILTSAPLWTVGSFVGISSDSIFRMQKPREVLSLIHNAFSKIVSSRFVAHALLSSLC